MNSLYTWLGPLTIKSNQGRANGKQFEVRPLLNKGLNDQVTFNYHLHSASVSVDL